MPRRPTGNPNGHRPGEFNKPKPLTENPPARGPSWRLPRLRRLLERPPVPPVPLAIRVHVTDEFEFYANENGSIYHDAGLQSPSRFQIFERVGDGFERDGDAEDE